MKKSTFLILVEMEEDDFHYVISSFFNCSLLWLPLLQVTLFIGVPFLIDLYILFNE